MIIHPPPQTGQPEKIVHDYQSAQKNAKYQWDQKSYFLSLIYYGGFFITPTIQLTIWLTIFLTDRVPLELRHHILWGGRAAARALTGPLFGTLAGFMLGDILIEEQMGPLITKVNIHATPCEGILVQWFMYFTLLFSYDSLMLFYYKFRDPKPMRSNFRTVCYTLSLVLLIATCLLPYKKIQETGAIMSSLLKNSENPKHIDMPKTYFNKLPYIYGASDWSVHFWFWLIFFFILPITGSLLKILNQIVAHDMLEFWTVRCNMFWMFDVYLVVDIASKLTEDASNKYRVETTMKDFCAQLQVTGDACMKDDTHFQAGFYCMLACVILYYLPDLKFCCHHHIYEKHFAPDTYEFHGDDRGSVNGVTDSKKNTLASHDYSSQSDPKAWV